MAERFLEDADQVTERRFRLANDRVSNRLYWLGQLMAFGGLFAAVLSGINLPGEFGEWDSIALLGLVASVSVFVLGLGVLVGSHVIRLLAQIELNTRPR